MKSLSWAALAIAGFMIMIGSYEHWLRLDSEAPWGAGFLCIGKGEPAARLDAATIVSTRLRFLPLDAPTEAMFKAVEASSPGRGPALKARLQRKLIEFPMDEMPSLAGWLSEGRMPESGRDELLGGCESQLGEEFQAAGKRLKVVGVLAPSVALFSDSVLAPADPALEPVLGGTDPGLSPVHIVRMTSRQFQDRKVHGQIARAFPSDSFSTLPPRVISNAAGYHAYLAGQALFLIGGTFLFILLYRWLADRVRWPTLAVPLAEIVGRPRLFLGIHVAYFGLYFLAAALIHHNTAYNAVMMTGVQQAFTTDGPLGVAAQAYQSGNMLRAAIVTFGVNLFLGSILVITLPSMIIPGAGVLVAGLRAVLWGLLLGPLDVSMALAMIPHSGTLLLEGEGYILATFFALLIPIIVFGRGRAVTSAVAVEDGTCEQPEAAGPETVGRRFARAIGLNLRSIVLVALVLGVAACYEAVEVISMAGL